MGTQITDPRDQFLSEVNLERSRISSFDGFIFLCGGSMHNWDANPASARAALRKAIQRSENKHIEDRLWLAEDLISWFNESTLFKDLITFEEHLAALSSVIILIVEAPGAIAELGSFAATKEIRERLLIVIGEKYYNEKSFIKLGPISFLEKNFDIRSYKYDWHQLDKDKNIVPIFNKFCDYTGFVLDEVNSKLKRPSAEEIFQPQYRKHKLLLIASLCSICVALTAKELHDYLRILEITLDPDPLDQYLFVLEKANMIQRKEFHNNTYYMCFKETNIKFRFRSKTLDLPRLQFDISRYYEKSDDCKYMALRETIGSGSS